MENRGADKVSGEEDGGERERGWGVEAIVGCCNRTSCFCDGDGKPREALRQ